MAEYEDNPEETGNYLRPVVERWTNLITEAKHAKRGFQEVASQCDHFFRMASGFMWKPKFKSKYMGANIEPPKFEVTVAKAFELVALFGPTLYWQYPHRAVRDIKQVEIEPEVFQNPQFIEMLVGIPVSQMEPEMQQQISQQVFQQHQQSSAAEQATRRLTNELMEKYLNYSQREQPYGGLSQASELAITEALVKGRGCLWPETYTYPGGEHTATGCFWDSVDNLFVDPDCEDPTLSDATWIARRHEQPTWVVERRFGLKKGSLKNYATSESADSYADKQQPENTPERKAGHTHDMIEWWEIWSKGGVGGRNHSLMNPDVMDGLDEVVGDFAYLCVAKGMPYPLNVTTRFLNEASDDELYAAMRWPVPYWRDNRWPVVCLDFYRHHGSAWPIAPMAPGLGELMGINVLLGCYLSGAYENHKQIIAVLQSAKQSLETALHGSQSPAIVEITDAAGHTINEIIQFVNRPEGNKDILEAMAILSTNFDKRVGLSEIMYSMNTGGTQSRTARDVAAKEEKASIRPDYMSKRVAEWQTEAANIEKFLARWELKGEDLRPLLGAMGGLLWQKLITESDPDTVIREMKATVEASNVRKPNKERESQNVQAMLGYMMPMLQEYAAATFDTNPLNNFLELIGDASDQEMEGLKLGPWQPQPDPMQQQMQQQQMQAEQQKLQADMQGKQLDLQGKQMDLQGKAMDMQSKQGQSEGRLAEQQAKLQMGQVEAMLNLNQDQASHDQEMGQRKEQHMLDLLIQREQAEQKMRQAHAEGALKLRQQKQQSQQQGAAHAKS